MMSGGMTRVHFSLTGGKRAYDVHLVGTSLACKAPCILDVPNGKGEFLFTSPGSEKIQAKYRTVLAGGELDVELARQHSTGMRVAGNLLVTFGVLGIIGGVGGLIWWGIDKIPPTPLKSSA